MFGVGQVAVIPTKRIPQHPIRVQLLLDPQRSRHQVGLESAWRDAEVGLEDALEFQQRLVIETDRGQITDFDSCGLETELDRLPWEIRVTLFPREALFLT